MKSLMDWTESAVIIAACDMPQGCLLGNWISWSINMNAWCQKHQLRLQTPCSLSSVVSSETTDSSSFSSSSVVYQKISSIIHTWPKSTHKLEQWVHEHSYRKHTNTDILRSLVKSLKCALFSFKQSQKIK